MLFKIGLFLVKILDSIYKRTVIITSIFIDLFAPWCFLCFRQSRSMSAICVNPAMWFVFYNKTFHWFVLNGNTSYQYLKKSRHQFFLGFCCCCFSRLFVRSSLKQKKTSCFVNCQLKLFKYQTMAVNINYVWTPDPVWQKMTRCDQHCFHFFLPGHVTTVTVLQYHERKKTIYTNEMT